MQKLPLDIIEIITDYALDLHYILKHREMMKEIVKQIDNIYMVTTVSRYFFTQEELATTFYYYCDKETTECNLILKSNSPFFTVYNLRGDLVDYESVLEAN